MADILTLTLNPALDLFTSVDQVVPAHKLRCGPHQMHPGGGGINVARVLHRLGADVLALFTAGGVTGERLSELLAQEGLRAQAVPIGGETRESFTVHEGLSGQDYRFVLPGPALTETEWQACLHHVPSCLPARFVVASGSLPPGVPSDFHARLAQCTRQAGARFVLDSSGPALAAALQAGVWLVKPSLRELRELTGLPLESEPHWVDATRALILQGQAEIVALSLGEQGALLVTADAAWRAQALPVAVASTIGAGDSFLAGLVWALSQSVDLSEALRLAMAAGAAALLTAGTALCQPADIARLAPEVAMRAL